MADPLDQSEAKQALAGRMVVQLNYRAGCPLSIREAKIAKVYKNGRCILDTNDRQQYRISTGGAGSETVLTSAGKRPFGWRYQWVVVDDDNRTKIEDFRFQARCRGLVGKVANLADRAYATPAEFSPADARRLEDALAALESMTAGGLK